MGTGKGQEDSGGWGGYRTARKRTVAYQVETHEERTGKISRPAAPRSGGNAICGFRYIIQVENIILNALY